MHRLDADLALPGALEPALVLLLGAVGRALPPLAALAEAESLGAEGLGCLCGEGALSEGRARGAHDCAGDDHPVMAGLSVDCCVFVAR